MRVKVTKQTKIKGVKKYPGDIVDIDQALFNSIRTVVELPDYTAGKKNIKTPLGIVVLLSGKANVRRLQDWLRDCIKPTETSLYIVDSSNRPKFTQRIHRWLGSSAMQQFVKVVYMTKKSKWHLKKTDTVADLYNVITPQVTERYFITLEDDVIPPLNGIEALLEKPSDATAYALSYMSRHGGYAVSEEDVFKRIPEMRTGVAPVQAVAGGFTLWLTKAFRHIKRDRPYKGWDDWLCSKIRSEGGKIYCNFNILCEHLY